jgi:hypothetical protein
VLLIRVIDRMAESICSWFASRSSFELPPVLAASTTSALIELSSSLTSASDASVVAITELARSPFLIACSTPLISVPMRSEMISPAGSSPPRLMRRPVARRFRRTCRLSFDRVRLNCATMLGVFELILDMAILRDCGCGSSRGCPRGRRSVGYALERALPGSAISPCALVEAAGRAGPGLIV